MFMCDVTKTLPYALYFGYSELLYGNGDVSIRFDGKDDNVVIEYSFLDYISVDQETVQSDRQFPLEKQIRPISSRTIFL